MPAPLSTFETLRDAAAAQPGFSGVVRVDVAGSLVGEAAFGWADRAHAVAATSAHRFGVASVAKGFTAVTIASLVEDGTLGWDTPVRPILGADLPLIDDAVTVDHLLTHRSGIGDYLDEFGDGAMTDYVMPVPVHTLDSVAAYLPVLDGHAQVFAPGSAFAYNNSGYVVLSLLAERVTGTPFADLVAERVLAPVGMTASGFPRSDELPDDVARGYLFEDGLRTNVLHLPVCGAGDGGPVTTAADLASFWTALFADRIVGAPTRARLFEPVTTGRTSYGRGFSVGAESGVVMLEGYDAGVSARTWYDPATTMSATVIASWTDGAWPVLHALDEGDDDAAEA